VKKIIIASLSLLILFGFSLTAFAAGPDKIPDGPQDMDALVGIINNIANAVFYILLAVAVIMLLVAAFTWLTAAGNEEKITSARKMLIWALVGVAVALLSKGLVTVITSVITTK